ncbi:hypothetical protein K456DRAFT_1946412 [Colletotrichum gloeosporioides 23]|nr:hypothetical protein K456DRAFT_1946412 [Colletotrichum gloeosporioides 23]
MTQLCHLSAFHHAVRFVGKTPGFCRPDSAVVLSYAICVQCIEVNVPDVILMRDQHLNPKFGDFLDYCWSLASIKSYALPQLITRTRTIISDIEIAGSVLRSKSIVIVTVTWTELREDAGSVPVVVTSSARTSRAEPTKETTLALKPVRSVPAPSFNAWIIGPVVGSMCAILLVLICCWFVRRRRRENSSPPTVIGQRADDKHEKPELHANHVAREPPVEIGGSYPVPVPEMGANEVPAQEMLVSTTVAEMPEMPEKQKCKLSLLLFPKWSALPVLMPAGPHSASDDISTTKRILASLGITIATYAFSLQMTHLE